MRPVLLMLLTGCATEADLAKVHGTPRLVDEVTDEAADGPAGEPDGAESGDENEPPAPCGLDADGRLAAPEGAFVPQDSPLDGVRERCAGVLHATSAAADSTLEVALEDWSGTAWLEVHALDGSVLAGAALDAGEALTFVAPQSGELLVSVQPEDPDADAHPYTLATRCLDGCRPHTRHPIVLMHGMAGDDAWIGVFDYFVGVEDDLADAGYLAVAPGVDAFNTVEARAALWQGHLDELEAAGVGRRFNLIGHSQGGLDARYLASALDDARVVSITTVATPHHGTAVADIATGVLDATPLGSWAADAVVDLMALMLGLGEAELTEQVRGLSTDAALAFNADVPDRADVPYWSWAGRTCVRTDWECLNDNEGEITNAFFALTTRIVTWAEGENDGLVSVESSRWGEFLGVLPADHIDSVGIHDPTATAPLDHRAFYRDEAARLASEGL